EDPGALRSPDREVAATDAPGEAGSPSSPGASQSAVSTTDISRERGVVLFLGTSLTEGYGLGNAQEHAFPARVQALINRAALPFRVVNAGVGGDTSAGGLRRLEWLLRMPVRVLVIELGANDGLRGQDVDALRSNLLAVIGQTRARYPEVEILLAGMQAPPNLGQRYTESFRAVFPEVAREADVALIPFLLEDVGGIRELNQADGIHPSVEGHEIIAETVWTSLEPVLRRIDGR
ncbi:MAG: arylesterase, partial [Gammaproteobacteria bacterium]|nr:arylesterase [Gammaproteobacteria bacterium]